MATLSWTTHVQISGQAPIVLERAPAVVEAHDFVEVALPPGAVDVAVALQPGPAKRIRLLALRADRYGNDITFTVSDGTDDTAALPLDEPQLYAASAIALFGLAPTILRFSNGGAEAAVVEVFVFRDAAP